MPFRENEEAALARAEALAEKVEELEKERDELLREKKAHDVEDAERRKNAPDPPPKDPDPPRAKSLDEPSPMSSKVPTGRGYLIATIIAGVVIAVVIGFAVVRNLKRGNAEQTFRDQTAARDALITQWNAAVSVEPCVRMIELDTISVRATARKNINAKNEQLGTYVLTRARSNCTDGAKTLIGLASTPIPAKNALQTWLAREAEMVPITTNLATYYNKHDFKDDNFASAPAMWQSLLDTIDRRQAALADVRKIAFPALRTIIHDREASEDAMRPRGDLVWRVELGLMLWDIDETVYRVSGISDGVKTDYAAAGRAIHDPLQALVDHAKLAPVESRRALRANDSAISAILAGNLTAENILALSSHDLLSSMRSDVPGLPPAPVRPKK